MSSKKQGYMVGSPTQVHATMQLMSTVLASMRAVSWLHWTAHWQVRGDYGDHLMFGKFYNDLIEEIDTLAEKCVGYFGATAVDPFKQMAKAQECMERFKKFDCLHERGLAAEEDLQVTLRSAHKVLKDLNAMTLGLDDYIQSLANTHESNIYLLQQRIGKEDGRPGIEKPPFDFSLVGEISAVQKKASDKEAFNKYNAPELLSQLFAVLGKFELDDAIDELKRKKVPQLVNDAWRNREKRGSKESMETTWFSAAYLYSTDEENEDG